MTDPGIPYSPMQPDDPERQGYERYLLTKSIFRDVRRISCFLAITLFLEAGVLLLFQPISSLIGFFLQATGLLDNETAMEIIDELYTMVVYVTAFLLPYLLYSKLCGFELRRIPKDRPYTPTLFSCLGLALGVSLVGGFLSTVALTFFSSVGLQPPDLDFGYPSNVFALTLNLINGTLLPAVVEELVYRGIILGSLRKYGDGCAIFVSSLLFGLAHGNMAQLPHAFLIGLAIAYLVVKTNSIYTGIFIHFMNNLIVTVLDLVSLPMNDMQYTLLGAGQTLFYLVCCIAGLIYLLAGRHADWRLYPSGCPVSQGTVTRRFLFSWPMALALVMLVWEICASFT